MCPHPVRRVPAVAGFLDAVDDGLTGFCIRTSVAELDGHLPVLPALEQAHAGKVVGRDTERVGNNARCFCPTLSAKLWPSALGSAAGDLGGCEFGATGSSAAGGSATAVAAPSAGESGLTVVFG